MPYLDYRPLTQNEPNIDAILSRPECSWISRELEQKAQVHAISQIVLEHPQEVRTRRLGWIDKTRVAVKDRLTKEIIVGDSFGVDRIDYLLRDSHHAGVGYGKFDHYRLIDNLRILPSPKQGPTSGEEPSEPALGVEEGGLHSAEALLLARYFMYTQVYIHPIRRIYDIHLQEFLTAWLPETRFSTELEKHLRMTDNEVLAGILAADLDEASNGHAHARRIVRREHFKILYQRQPSDVEVNPDAAKAVFRAAAAKYGVENVRYDEYRGRAGGVTDFPVLTKDHRIVSAIALSTVLKNLPVTVHETVFIVPNLIQDAAKWLEHHRNEITQPAPAEE